MQAYIVNKVASNVRDLIDYSLRQVVFFLVLLEELRKRIDVQY